MGLIWYMLRMTLARIILLLAVEVIFHFERAWIVKWLRAPFRLGRESLGGTNMAYQRAGNVVSKTFLRCQDVIK